MSVELGTVVRSPDRKIVAIKTNLPDPRTTWFVFDTSSGGYYSDGTRERFMDEDTDWQELETGGGE